MAGVVAGNLISNINVNIVRALIVLAAAVLAQSEILFAAEAANTPDVNAIVASMVRAHAEKRAQNTAYELIRNYRVYRADNAEPKSQVTAFVSFLPPGSKTYKITESTGGVAERVVRNALEREVELTKNPSESEISQKNYDFALAGQDILDGNRCYVLILEPKRDSKDLLRGKAWVDARTFLIRRVEGEPTKNLSWWLRNVHVTLMYNDVSGMWMRTASHASAHVRFSGDVNFVSRDVDFRPIETVASARPAPARLFRQEESKPSARPHRRTVRSAVFHSETDELGGSK